MFPKTALVCALLFAVASAQQSIKVNPCADPGQGKIRSITVTPCDAEPCRMKKGADVTFGFEYTSDQDSKAVTLQGTVAGPFGIKIPIPGLIHDFCQVVKCPVQKATDYKGSFQMKIAKVPITKTTVEMKVIGDSGLSACFNFPVVLY